MPGGSAQTASMGCPAPAKGAMLQADRVCAGPTSGLPAGDSTSRQACPPPPLPAQPRRSGPTPASLPACQPGSQQAAQLQQYYRRPTCVLSSVSAVRVVGSAHSRSLIEPSSTSPSCTASSCTGSGSSSGALCEHRACSAAQAELQCPRKQCTVGTQSPATTRCQRQTGSGSLHPPPAQAALLPWPAGRLCGRTCPLRPPSPTSFCSAG